MKPIGSTSQFINFPKRSHTWAEKMNDNIVKTATALHASCKAFVDTLPVENMEEGDVYVLKSTKHIYVWVNEVLIDTIGPVVQPAQWYDMTPAGGYLILNLADMCYYVYAEGDWKFVWNIGAQHRVVQRELAFYNPYLVRPRSTLFLYVSGLELTLPEDLPGSLATLEIPASKDVSLAISVSGGQGGSINFEAGQTTGSIYFPQQRSIFPAINETRNTQAGTLTVTSPDDTGGMQGLSVSLRGQIRSIDQ